MGGNGMKRCIGKIALIGWVNMVLFSANVMAESITIGALSSGQVSKVFVSEGQRVNKGQALLELDTERYQAQRKVLLAKSQVAQLQMNDMKKALDLALDLYDRTVSATRSRDAAQLAYDQAKAEYDKAQAKLAVHAAKKKYVYINAPVAGTVKKRFVAVGSTVFKENNPLIELSY